MVVFPIWICEPSCSRASATRRPSIRVPLVDPRSAALTRTSGPAGASRAPPPRGPPRRCGTPQRGGTDAHLGPGDVDPDLDVATRDAGVVHPEVRLAAAP